MRQWLPMFSVVFSAVLIGNAGAALAAESKAVQTIATILLTLNHYPSASDNATLKNVADDKATTAQERVLAQALINVQHTASSEDTPKLQALMKDESVPASIRTLASILSDLNHTPSAADKDKLTQLLQ